MSGIEPPNTYTIEVSFVFGKGGTMPEANGAGNTRTILIDPMTNCMYTTDPTTGQPVLITDPATGMPLANQILSIDSTSGCYFVTNPATGQASWVIDPLTGRPMVGATPTTTARPAMQGQLGSQAQTAVSPNLANQPFQQASSSTTQTIPAQQPSTPGDPFGGAVAAQGQYVQPHATQFANEATTPHAGPSPSEMTNAQQPLGTPAITQPNQFPNNQAAASPTQPDQRPNTQMAPEQPIMSGASYQNYEMQMGAAATQPATSAMAITALVIGLLAIATSFIPIINFGSFVLALLSAIFAIVGIVSTGKGKKKGQGMAVAGLLLSIAAVGIAFATQSLFGMYYNNVLEQIQHGPSPVAVSPVGDNSAGSAGQNAANGNGQGNAAAPTSANGPQADYSTMKPGQTATFENGLSVTVNSIRSVKKSYDNSTMTEVSITYANAGSSNESFNVLDWKAEDKNGAIRNTAVYSGDNPLSSGALSPGGTVTGNVYFDGSVAKVYYYNNVMQSGSNICWIAE